MKPQKNGKGAILFCTVAALLLFLCGTGKFICPILYFAKIPCPTCGMTRALLCALRLDVRGYLHYNAMAIPMGIAVLIAFSLKYLPYKKAFFSYVVTASLINFIYYALRLTEGFG